MPLNRSCSEKAVSENIALEMRSGRTQKQAIAIALATLRQCLPVNIRAKAEQERWSPKRIIAAAKRTRKNPYPLLIATLANPNKFASSFVDKGIEMHHESHGNNTDVSAVVKNIAGIPDGEVLVYQGDLVYFEYQNRQVKNSSKGNDVWGHKKGDIVNAKVPNIVKMYRAVSNPNLCYLVAKNRLIINGMFEG